MHAASGFEGICPARSFCCCGQPALLRHDSPTRARSDVEFVESSNNSAITPFRRYGNVDPKVPHPEGSPILSLTLSEASCIAGTSRWRHMPGWCALIAGVGGVMAVPTTWSAVGPGHSPYSITLIAYTPSRNPAQMLDD